MSRRDNKKVASGKRTRVSAATGSRMLSTMRAPQVARGDVHANELSIGIPRAACRARITFR